MARTLPYIHFLIQLKKKNYWFKLFAIQVNKKKQKVITSTCSDSMQNTLLSGQRILAVKTGGPQPRGIDESTCVLDTCHAGR